MKLVKYILTLLFLVSSVPVYSMDMNSENEMSIKKKNKKKGKKLKGKEGKGKKGGAWNKWKSKWKKKKEN